MITSKLTSTKTNKNGKPYKVAAPELNKIRKDLFGEDLE